MITKASVKQKSKQTDPDCKSPARLLTAVPGPRARDLTTPQTPASTGFAPVFETGSWRPSHTARNR